MEITIHVKVVCEQGVEADAQRLILDAIKHRVIHRYRRIIHWRQVDLHRGGGLAAKAIANRVIKPGITVMVLGA